MGRTLSANSSWLAQCVKRQRGRPLNSVVMQLDGRVREVRGAIFQAFDALDRPSGLNVAPHECLECDGLRRSLAAYDFDEVPDEVLDGLRDKLPLLGPKGLQYYLPAYLLRVLKEPEWDGAEYVMYHLNPSRDDFAKSEKYWKDRLGIFSSEQRKAVLRFLEWFELTQRGADYLPEIVGARDVWNQAA